MHKIEKYMKQCRGYVYEHFTGSSGYEKEDVVQEMLFLIWQSYMNGNGLSRVLKEQKLIPQWQLKLLFLNALRELKSDSSYSTETLHPEPARVVKDETGIIDYFYPFTPDPLEEEEEIKESKIPQGRERERWLERIRRLREKGYSDKEIVEMLKPVKQEVLF